MRNVYTNQLEELKVKIQEMGTLCEDAISLAVTAISSDADNIKKDVEATENAIDRKQREIEQLCMKLLLLQAPFASDLREVSAAMHMSTDMERIGDQAYNISTNAFHIPKDTTIEEERNQLREMATVAIHMIEDSIEAFVKGDLQLAQGVALKDYAVDNWFIKIRQELGDAITSGDWDKDYILEIMMSAKYLERIGDHAVNLSEQAIFAINGERSES